MLLDIEAITMMLRQGFITYRVGIMMLELVGLLMRMIRVI